MIHLLQSREDRGECDLWYFDSAGFCLEPCVPYAWQPIGDYIKVPASSHGRRLNVLGFVKRDNQLVPYMLEESVDAEAIIESFDHLSDQIEKRSYVLIDNAPMHRSKAWLFAMIEAPAKSFHNGLICAFGGCVHFASHRPFVESV